MQELNQGEIAPRLPRPIVCVGVVCFKGNQVLMIERLKPPRQAHWSIPGGKIERGETVIEACERELFEETGIKASQFELVDVYDLIEEGYHYVLIDYRAKFDKGVLKASSDAKQAHFMDIEKALEIVVENDLKHVLTKAWHMGL